ncbi:MAG: DUF5985 family protein [Lysobacterales bacterium]
MEHVLTGAIAMGFAVIALVFLRYWRTTRDRFFLFFALSFGIEAVNRVVLGLSSVAHEDRPAIYFVRLLVYALILVAIVDKNVRRKH